MESALEEMEESRSTMRSRKKKKCKPAYNRAISSEEEDEQSLEG